MSRTDPELESLDQQLQDAFRRADLPAAPGRLRADVEALPSSTRNVAAYVGRARLARWPRSSIVMALLAAAAAITVVAVGLPILLAQPQVGHASPTASRLAPTATPSPSLSPQPVVMASDGSSIVTDGPSIAWTNVPLGQFGSNTVWAVGAAQIGGTMVVAANDSSQNDMKPVIIKSTNGTDWTRVPTGGTEFANARLDFLLSVPGGLLLVGESLLRDPLCAGGAFGCNPVSATLMWRSSDGQTWQPLSGTALAPFNRVWIYSMAVGSKGLVALGLREPVEGSGQIVVFHSMDGTSWSSADFPDQNGGMAGVNVQRVTATPSGFVAIGYVNTAADASEGAAWYSSDGLTWTRATTPAGSTDGPLYAASGSTGMVATTNAIVAASNVVWVSADGKIWQTAETSPFIDGSGWLTGDGNQILVISGSTATWSQDGKTWHRGGSTPTMPDLGAAGFTTSLAWIFGSTVIAVSPDGLSLYVGSVGAP